ncbi:hypothetical protein [Nostocoides sp. Soil756]|uniref:hypothetical protein n=1 Tax=Nostocoides sp. Soil756 TaxID=1736399 RepID=UPI0006F7D880|nr:hypothetical protein [Tetrasphaera sp. Soil756]KRE62545.1 hypothetical protein ASG78_05885 [Tetrasphaera sp. Soil756]
MGHELHVAQRRPEGDGGIQRRAGPHDIPGAVAGHGQPEEETDSAPLVLLEGSVVDRERLVPVARAYGEHLAALYLSHRPAREPILLCASGYLSITPAAHAVLPSMGAALRAAGTPVHPLTVHRANVSDGDYAVMDAAQRARTVTDAHDVRDDPRAEGLLNAAAVTTVHDLLGLANTSTFVPNARFCKATLLMSAGDRDLFISRAPEGLVDYVVAAIRSEGLVGVPAYASAASALLCVRAPTTSVA